MHIHDFKEKINLIYIIYMYMHKDIYREIETRDRHAHRDRDRETHTDRDRYRQIKRDRQLPSNLDWSILKMTVALQF